jgi:hypothetical protein
MTASPQLRALGPHIRVLAVFLDGIAAYGRYCEAVQARVDTAWLNEARSGDGWQVTPGERVMAERGWRTAEDIFNEAGIPEKHRRVVEYALIGRPKGGGRGMFTHREIAKMTGHPLRAVRDWLDTDMPRLERLAASLELQA